MNDMSPNQMYSFLIYYLIYYIDSVQSYKYYLLWIERTHIILKNIY